MYYDFLFLILQRKDDNQRIPSMSITAYEEEQRKQRAFVQNLYSFMKARLTPIGRLPLLGSKESEDKFCYLGF